MQLRAITKHAESSETQADIDDLDDVEIDQLPGDSDTEE
jgi:hypothetical protein